MRPPEGHPARAEIASWIQDHPQPSAADLAVAGLVAPHWPRPWGRGADVVTQLVIDEELAAAGIQRPDNQIGIGWAGPTILEGGTPEQQQRFLPRLLSGEDFWCQLFSEPGAGSDLASLTTRAVRDGDTYVVNGQKVWTTWADRAQLGILLVRTDHTVPKHKGITYLVCPMDAPGITIRPIREMSGGSHFNEVFLDDVPVPVANRIGAEGDGWRLATVTLANERVSLSTGGLCWGMGPTTDDFLDGRRIADPVRRQEAAAAATHGRLLGLLGERTMAAMAAGRPPGPEASVKKVLADEQGQRVTDLWTDLQGPAGVTGAVGHDGDDDPDAEWRWATLFARALTIGGGTGEVQRNLLAERVLGLPRSL